MEWLHVMKGRVHRLLHSGLHAIGTAAMSAAKLCFSDRNSVASFKFAANATAMLSWQNDGKGKKLNVSTTLYKTVASDKKSMCGMVARRHADAHNSAVLTAAQ